MTPLDATAAGEGRSVMFGEGVDASARDPRSLVVPVGAAGAPWGPPDGPGVPSADVFPEGPFAPPGDEERVFELSERPVSHLDPCSVDDVFEVRPLTHEVGGWRAVSVANFAELSDLDPEAAIADTTVQRTLADAVSSSGTVFPAGSVRMYVSVEGHGEYSLLSSDGLHFEFEGSRLAQGQGQAESFWDGSGVWMYYHEGRSTPHGVWVKRSSDGLDFESDAETDYASGHPTGLTNDGLGLGTDENLTGLSVVETGSSHRYRGYFGVETTESRTGVIYAAYSDDLLNWTVESPSRSVGERGEILGRQAARYEVISSASRQPFALKRHDPNHPDAVTLFYYRPLLRAPGSHLHYCTALDGLTFETENERLVKGLGDGRVDGGGAVAGPTLMSVEGLRGWRAAEAGTYLLYVDTVVAESDQRQTKFIQAVSLRKVT